MGVEAGDHRDSGGGVNVPGDDWVQAPDGDLGVERSGDGVLRIDRTNGSGDLYLAVAGQRRAHREGKSLGQRDVLQLHVEVIVDLEIFLRWQRFYRGVAVFDGDKADRDKADCKIGWSGRLTRVLPDGSVAQRGEVPSPILGANQMDLGSIGLKASHNDLPVEDERLHLNANAQSFRGEEWSLAKLRVLGYSKIVRHQASCHH